MSTKHVLFTGCTGRIGPRILQEFASTDYRIRVLLKNEEDIPSTVEPHADELIWGDILDRKTWLNAIHGVDSIVHLAGASDEMDGVLYTNLHSSRLLAEACLTATVTRIVFASSSCVVRKHPWSNKMAYTSLPVDESHPMRPSGYYGLSKLLSEKLLNNAANNISNLKVVALRLTWVLSIEDIQRRVWDDLPNEVAICSLWSYVHIDDAARAFVLAHESSLSKPFEAMYVSAEDTFSKYYSEDLLNQYYPELQKCKGNLTGYNSFYSWAKAARVIGYTPINSIHQQSESLPKLVP